MQKSQAVYHPTDKRSIRSVVANYVADFEGACPFDFPLAHVQIPSACRVGCRLKVWGAYNEASRPIVSYSLLFTG